MNKTHEADDNLSALLDGELSDQSARLAIRRLSGDPARRARFAEYCAIGDLLRGHHNDLPDLTQKVMAALEDEPTVLAPVQKTPERRPLLWLAAATCAAITWGLWGAAPRQEPIAPLAAAQMPAPAPADAMPYLAAHQDYAQAVLTVPEMHFTRVSLSKEAR
ncbi:MAG: sigma-E factor negative regulatory protein [Pseudomonadota bacterium]|nr:sigma-E factor negative regulatory protein [Pseudomonadota bacterium]